MIDLNRIRSLKTLETIKKTLTEFLSNPEILNVYREDYGWGEEDYEADINEVKEMLESIEHRMKSLGRFIARQNASEKDAAKIISSVV